MPNRPPKHNRKAPARQASDKRYDWNRNRYDPVRIFRNSSRWIKCRKLFKKHHPLCFDPFGEHEKAGHVVKTKDIHHIVPLAVNLALGLVWANLAALCGECHDKIERMETRGQGTRELFMRKKEL